MTDEVADTNSAEVDYATIDGANVGLVKIIITEGIVVADSTTKHKAVSKTLTEGVAVADTVPSKHKVSIKIFIEVIKSLDVTSKFKSVSKVFSEAVKALDTIPSKFKLVTKTFSEAIANLDTIPNKFKAATKTFVEKVKVQDQSYFLPFVVIRRLYEYPAQRIKTGFLWAHIGKTHIGYYYHRIKSILDED
jgi:hypothetical protein